MDCDDTTIDSINHTDFFYYTDYGIMTHSIIILRLYLSIISHNYRIDMFTFI